MNKNFGIAGINSYRIALPQSMKCTFNSPVGEVGVGSGCGFSSEGGVTVCGGGSGWLVVVHPTDTPDNRTINTMIVIAV